MGVKAEVVDINPDGTLDLRAGIMSVKLKPEDVYLIEGHAAKQKKQSVTIAGSTAPRAAVVRDRPSRHGEHRSRKCRRAIY